VRIDPTRRDAQAMTLHILTAAGAPVPARTVTATLSSAQVAALRLTLRRLTADGSQWATSAAVVPLPGCGRSPLMSPSGRPTRTPPPPATGSGDSRGAS